MNSITKHSGPAALGNSVSHAWVREGPVLIVDDDANDAVRTEGIIDVSQPRFRAQILTSGEDLVAYLQGDGLYSDRSRYPCPALILLDLKMPKMDGFEVLQWLQDHPEHSNVPVVVLSGWFELSIQVMRAYQLGARSFLPKPIQPHDVQGVLALLKISI